MAAFYLLADETV